MFPDTQLGLFDLLVAIVVFQYLFIAVFLFRHRNSKTGKSTNTFLLAIFFCLVSVNLIDGELMRHGIYYHLPSLALLEDSLVLVYGPLLYFYTLGIVQPDRTRSRKDLLHYVPALVLLLIIVFTYTIRNGADQKRILEAIVHQQLPVASSLISFSVIFVHFFTYLILCFKAITNVSWLIFTLRTLGVTFFISWLASFASILQYETISEILLTSIVVVLLYFISSLLLKALKDPRIFDVSRPAIGTSEADELRSKLDKAMIEQRLYSQADLTLEKLSVQLGLQPRKLSQYLNEVRQQSFFDYINGLRIEEAKSILSNSKDPKLTVQEVMYRVGFNSKSSFNVLFKEKTGQTPSEFRKSGSRS